MVLGGCFFNSKERIYDKFVDLNVGGANIYCWVQFSKCLILLCKLLLTIIGLLKYLLLSDVRDL